VAADEGQCLLRERNEVKFIFIRRVRKRAYRGIIAAIWRASSAGGQGA